MRKTIKIAVIGDSISEGIGNKKYNYVDSLKACLINRGIYAEICNFSLTGTTIDYALEKLEEIRKYSPDYIFVLYGNVEAIIRPDIRKNNLFTRCLPKRYRKMFMLDPRPFYSSNIGKRFIQHLDNAYRYVMKKIAFRACGSYRLMEPEAFEGKYDFFVNSVMQFATNVICISNVRIDGTYFPESPESMEQFRRVIKTVACRNHVVYAALNEWQERFEWNQIYSCDHYHPNQEGYNAIGEFLGAVLMDEIMKRGTSVK